MAGLNPLPLLFQSDKTPNCIYDCLPLVLSARYCSALPSPSSSGGDQAAAYDRCLCDNPYILPLTTGQQCAFLCGRNSRAAIIDFIKGPRTRLADSIPGPETFAPHYSPGERWWRQWQDGQRFGIILGCVLGFIFVVLFLWGVIEGCRGQVTRRRSKA
ncbi:hypothetical protein DRE_04481 [Drechslerella stenobrocha 248]|uniref:Uncharacterized protein n=1 Tax=Drechslerella stenobrocha 248 TaxID=1043628 RepID=W7IB49_9PEZI|nr:hypothetical protein DRE_04481 [Drechslerella stenobrocha 248]